MLIRYSDIPSYLKEGKFYRSLNPKTSTEKYDVPENVFKVDESVGDVEDLHNILHVFTFWQLDRLPVSVLKFCHTKDLSEWESVVEECLSPQLLSALVSTFGHKVEQPIETVIATDRIELIEYWIQITESNSKYGMAATTTVCKAGRLEVLMLLHKEGFRWNKYTCEAAARYGHLECVKYLFENGCPWDVFTLTSAAWSGHVDCVIYVHDNGLQWHTDVTNAAAEMGHLECLIYLHQQGCPWDYRVVTNSAIRKHLPCLQYALEHDAPIDSAACTYACSGGHLESLRIMHQHGALLTANESMEAASYGKLDCLQYLHSNGCPWDENTTDSAAREGQIDTLKYTVEHQCPCSNDIVRLAAQSGHLLCLQYLVGNCSMCMNEDGSIFGTAFIRAHVECVQYLLTVNSHYMNYVYDWDSVMDIPADLLIQDEPFLQCIVCAIEHGWKYNNELISVINSNVFPLCQQYIVDNNWVME